MTDQVKGYQRTVNGHFIQVQAYERQNSEITDAGLNFPGRPPMAGKPGRYAENRALPNVWIKPHRVADAAAAEAQRLPAPTPPPVEEQKVTPAGQPSKKAQNVVEAIRKSDRAAAGR